MKAVYNFLFKNINLKILSLVIAAVFWFVGMNVHDPAMTDSFDVKVVLLNKDRITANNLYLLNEHDLENTTINVILRGRRSQIDELKKLEKDIVAIVDLSPIDISNAKDIGTPLSATVNIRFPNSVDESNFERVNMYPSMVDIRLDTLITINLPIQIEPIGEVEEGYVAYKNLAVVSPLSVRITGPKSIVDTVHTAKADVIINDATEQIKAKSKIKLFDRNNQEILTLQKNNEEAEVTMPVKKYAKIPINLPITIGTVAEDYRITQISLDISYVEVAGTEEELEEISKINLEPATVADISKTTHYTYDLKAYLRNTGLDIREGTPQEAVVTVVVEKEEIMDFKLNNIITHGTPAEGLTAKVPSEASIAVKGLPSELASLNSGSIIAYIELANIKEAGTYEVPLIMYGLPSGIREVETNYIEVKIEKVVTEGEDINE